MELKQSLRIQVQIAKFSEILTTVTIDYQSTLTYMFSWHRHRKVSEIIQGFRFHWLQISRTHSVRYRYALVSCQILLSSRFPGWQWQAGKSREIIIIACKICRMCLNNLMQSVFNYQNWYNEISKWSDKNNWYIW